MLRAIALAVALTVGVPACSHPDEPRVAFLLATLKEDRYQKDVRYFEARAKTLGMRVETRAADNDSQTQSTQVDEALAHGAKILVIQPTDSVAAASYVQRAHDHGAKVVAYDRAIVAADLDYYVSHDSYRVGVLQAEAALRATGGKGMYVLLSGEAGHSVAMEITRGYEDTLAPYIARGEVTIALAANHSAWSPEQAMRSVESALEKANHHIDAILANNSGMARGAVQAIAAAGVEGVFIAGADADAANINLVCQGKQTIEVLKDIQPLAKTAAEVARELLDGRRVEGASSMTLGGSDVPVAAVRVAIVTPENVKALLVDPGVLSADELPACKSRLAVK